MILLWAWGLVLTGVILHVLESQIDFILGSILILIVLTIFVTLSVITWKWLSGKEN